MAGDNQQCSGPDHSLLRESKGIIRSLAYETGLLSCYRRFRNRSAVTVLLFHRVLPPDDPRWETADHRWTISQTLFEDCIRFCVRHYKVISMRELVESLDNHGDLPAHAMLVTFDDGWSDNSQYAAPVLKKYLCPATIFVTAQAVDEENLWHDEICRRWKDGQLSPGVCQQVWEAVGGGRKTPLGAWKELSSIFELTARLAGLPKGDRDRLVLILGVSRRSPIPEMLSSKELRDLATSGIAIGCHGMTHTPIPFAIDQDEELGLSRKRLQEILAPIDEEPVFAFPHGRYNRAAVKAVRDHSYRALFTSDPTLNRSVSLTTVLGRINMDAAQFVDASGKFCPERLATWLWLRPTRAISETEIPERGNVG
jgi:peptidoglycan/xylan/chitin deacetylase (PgdA/CDA1 family)